MASSVFVRRQELGNDFVCSVDVTRINIAHVCHAHNAQLSPPLLHIPLLIPPLMHRGAVAYYRNCICHKTAAPTSWPALPCFTPSCTSSPLRQVPPTCRLYRLRTQHFLDCLYSIAAAVAVAASPTSSSWPFAAKSFCHQLIKIVG